MDVNVTIDELDLTGVPSARRHQVAATFERELRRLLSEQPFDPTRASEPSSPLTIDVHLSANPVIVGTALAAAVLRALQP